MIVKQNIFGRGIAAGEAFCNRLAEIGQISQNIKNITHTLLISPRRYGKTSLALRAIETSKLPYVYIDLFMKYKSDEILDEFYQGIGSLLTQFIKPTQKAIRKIESILKNISVSLTLGKFGFEIGLSPPKSDKKNLKSLLTSVDNLLATQNQQAIIFIDEIQTISESELCDEIEAALRFVAQKTQHIVFIFSGSSRHLISKIFDDRSRPLYKLCQRMAVQRISPSHYQPFLNNVARRKWGKVLDEATFGKIFFYTQEHPYYVNVLCSYLFELTQLPTEEDIDNQWEKVCKEEQASIAKDIEFLTAKQKQLLREIAQNPHLKEPTAKDFVKNVDLTPRGILNALQILLKHDIVEKLDNSEIRVVDPVLYYWCKN